MQQTKRGRAMKSALLFIQVLCFRLHQIELALPGARTVCRRINIPTSRLLLAESPTLTLNVTLPQT